MKKREIYQINNKLIFKIKKNNLNKINAYYINKNLKNYWLILIK